MEETESKYTVNMNDLKYRKYRNLDKSKISTFEKLNKNEYNDDLYKIFKNLDLDTLQYRFHECINTNNKKILDLKYLELKTIPDLSIFYDTLEELYIGNNELEFLPDLSMFRKLLVLDVSINKIKKISKLPKNLIEFTCFDNFIEDISSIRDCRNLKTLYASNNLISDISFLNNNEKLTVLIINNNKLSAIPDNLINIRKIQINNNKIKKISSYNNLVYLTCQNNEIAEIQPCNNLIDLLISSNPLNTLPVFAKLKYLEILNTNISKLLYMENLRELICIKRSLKEISSKYKVTETSCHNEKYLNIFFE